MLRPLKWCVASLAAFLCLVPSAGAGTLARAANPIQLENAKPGSTAWQAEQAPFRYIEGYASQVSASPGDVVSLHVQTSPAARYRIDLYRLGWYGGAGGRRVACLPSCQADEQGVPQGVPPFDPQTGYVNAGWPITDTFRLPGDLVSGYYIALLVLTSGSSAGQTAKIPLIVREPDFHRSAILVQAPVNTWQAYNDWGGRSLYSSFNGAGSNHVSFDRPYVHGDQDLFEWEYQLVRFLEREGYDVSYTSSVDVDRVPTQVQNHRLVMVAGHDEYWTKSIRDAFERGRDVGTNLAFMGGNIGYWQIRYEDNSRTVVEYRDEKTDPEPDPALKTTLFTSLVPARPACTLLGVQWEHGIGPVSSLPVDDGALGDAWFRKTGFTPGSALGALVGGEWDSLVPGCAVPPQTVFFHYGGTPAPLDVTRYTAVSGARVFDASSLRWSWELDNYGTPFAAPDPRLQQFTRNALDDLTRPAPPLSIAARRGKRGVVIRFTAHGDPRVASVAVYRHPGGRAFTLPDRRAKLVCQTVQSTCVDRSPSPGPVRYAAVTRDRWGASYPVLTGVTR